MRFLRCRHILPVLLAVFLVSGCSSTRESAGWHDIRNYPQLESVETVDGIASYYHNKFHGRLTANGERYDKRELTAAHREYPFGTYVRVTSLANGNSVIVRINDRGPHIRNRIIDLSRAAAEELDMIHDGLAHVRVEVLAWGGS